MSLNTLAHEELNKALFHFRRTRDAATIPTLSGVEPDTSGSLSNALTVLVKYIPTEVITVYLAAVAAIPAAKTVFGLSNPERFVYWIFAALTPATLFLLYAGMRTTNGLLFPSAKECPWWKMIAATLAYLIWALAIPNNPYIHTPAEQMISGVGAVFISTLLNLLAPLFEHQPEPQKPR